MTNHAKATPILAAMVFCHFINDTLQAIMLSSYPLLKQTYALSFAQIGMITFAFQVTGSILQPAIGHYTDKRPIAFSLPVSTAFTIIGLALLGLATSYASLLIAAVAVGIGSAIFHPEASRLARIASGGRYGLAQSSFQVGGNFGTALGPLLAALIILPRGQHAILWFIALAAIAFATLTYASNWYKNHLVKSLANKPTPPRHHSLSNTRIFITMAILIALMISKFVYMASFHSFYPFYLEQQFGISITSAQIYLFVFLAAVAVGTFAGGPIGDRVGRKSVIWFSILGTLPFSLALPHTSLPMTIALTIIIGLILSSAFAAIVVYAQELLPGRVGMISGLFFGFAFGSGGIGAALLGRLADHTSIVYVYEICAYLPAIGLLAIFLPNEKQLKPIDKA
jgi:MFS transporter, FSR family, fosmidomycin resistance protein